MNKSDLQMYSQNRTHSYVGDLLTEIIENWVDLEKLNMTSSQKKKKSVEYQYSLEYYSTSKPLKDKQKCCDREGHTVKQ